MKLFLLMNIQLTFCGYKKRKQAKKPYSFAFPRVEIREVSVAMGDPGLCLRASLPSLFLSSSQHFSPDFYEFMLSKPSQLPHCAQQTLCTEPAFLF